MGQQEIFTFLKKNKNKWFTAKQIAQKIKTSFGSVTVSLKILRYSREIEYKIIRTNPHTVGKGRVFVYKFKE